MDILFLKMTIILQNIQKLNRLKIYLNFSGSAGTCYNIKKKNYLFTDGRYTIQSQIESGKNFKII